MCVCVSVCMYVCTWVQMNVHMCVSVLTELQLLDNNILCQALHKVHVQEISHQCEHRLLGRTTVPQARLLAAHIGKAVERGGASLWMQIKNRRRRCGALQVFRNCERYSYELWAGRLICKWTYDNQMNASLAPAQSPAPAGMFGSSAGDHRDSRHAASSPCPCDTPAHPTRAQPADVSDTDGVSGPRWLQQEFR